MRIIHGRALYTGKYGSRLFAEILNRLREGKHTEEDLRILKQRLISESDGNYPHRAPHLFYQNKKVECFNK